jgi:hypothetical protein
MSNFPDDMKHKMLDDEIDQEVEALDAAARASAKKWLPALLAIAKIGSLEMAHVFCDTISDNDDDFYMWAVCEIYPALDAHYSAWKEADKAARLERLAQASTGAVS